MDVSKNLGDLVKCVGLERKVCSLERAIFHIKQEADADLNTRFTLSLLEKEAAH